MAAYWDEAAMQRALVMPSILAIGDSWFWYPFPGGSLISYLGPIVEKKEHTILAQGMNGAEAFDYVDGKYKDRITGALRRYGSSLSAVFISGGGNDFAGFNDMRPLLALDCSGAQSAGDCFRSGDGGLGQFLERMDDHYRRLIGLIYTHTSLDCLILMHSYDYAIPDGRGVAGKAGWLKPALVDAGVPEALQRDCVRYLIDAFHAMLGRIAMGDPAHLRIVDSRGTLAEEGLGERVAPEGQGLQEDRQGTLEAGPPGGRARLSGSWMAELAIGGRSHGASARAGVSPGPSLVHPVFALAMTSIDGFIAAALSSPAR